ncbi:MAG: NAD(P)-dependent oxidoreductase [Planctomycetota bacterium]|nr:MAG: NAD(P)-dependent oxidoreductase [Planctomycetota bacterium]
MTRSASCGSAVVQEDIERLLARTSGLWEGLRGSHLFVTGGTGFFGRWLLEALVAADRAHGLDLRVTVLSRHPARFADKAPHLARSGIVTTIPGDVRNFVFPPGPVTHVIHAATEASASLDRDDSATMYDVCAKGTQRVLALAGENGASRFLLTSSGAVYGQLPDGMTRATERLRRCGEPPLSTSGYADGKREAERLCSEAGDGGMGITIARCFAFVGPYLPLDRHFAVGNFIRDAITGGPLDVRGDGTAVRSYLYAADLVEWLVTILLHGRPGRAYNVGSETGVTIGELARCVAMVAGGLQSTGSPTVQLAGMPTSGTAPDHYLPDCSRARDELGLRESTPLEEAIRRTIRHVLDKTASSDTATANGQGA